MKILIFLKNKTDDVVSLLLENGAKIDVEDKNGNTAQKLAGNESKIIF